MKDSPVNPPNQATALIETAMSKVVNVRNYQNEEINDEMLKKLFEVFGAGPSVANHQPWEILILDQKQKKEVIQATLDPLLSKDSYYGQPWIEHAPVVFVVMIDRRRSEARVGDIGLTFSKQDIFAALQNLRIFATLNGLGTSVVREFDMERLKKVFNLPKSYLPIGIVTVGYIDEEELELPPRLKIADFVHKGWIS